NLACEVCGKVMLAGRLPRHMNTRSGARPHKCDVCGAGFADKSNLRIRRPFACGDCGASFTTSGHLQRHRCAVHERWKPFACTHEGCDK
ncbi:hypothetical protein HER21_45000, partial [Pseudomonas sp. BGM005]|nr:hypothetical protein [Pseudomonas sp. BG5]